MAVDFIRILRNDMELFHDGPVGVLEAINGWGSGANMPEFTTRPSGWTHYVMWAHMTRDATGAYAPLSSTDRNRAWRDPRARIGNNAPNTRTHLRHHQILWLLSDGTWITGQYRDSANDRLYPFNWSEAGEIGMAASNYTASHPGGGSSMRAVGLANDPRNPGSPNQYRERTWHPYGTRNAVPANYVGWVTCLFGRLIVDNPNLPDDRAQCNMVGGCAFDWYISANPGSLVQTSSPSTSTVWYGGFSRFKYFTNDWQLFGHTNLSETQLRANPPPIVGLELLESTDTSTPPPSLGSGYRQLTAVDRASPAGATRALSLPAPPRAGATVLAHGGVWRFGDLPSVINRVYDHAGNLRLEQQESGNNDNTFSFCAIRENATPPAGGAAYTLTVEFAQTDFNRIAWNIGELLDGAQLTRVVKASAGADSTQVEANSGALGAGSQLLVGVGSGLVNPVDVTADPALPPSPPPPSPPPPSGTERIMVIGDSIADGSNPGDAVQYVSWLGEFQALMTAANRPHDMIGPTTAGLGGGPDNNCAAWGGASIDGAHGNANNITSRLDEIFATEYQPTRIVLAIGWNEQWDTAPGGSASTAPARWTTLFNAIRSRRPLVPITVCTLHKPSDNSTNANRTSLNNTIRAAATATPSLVNCADQDAQTFAAGDLADYVHLATAGAKKYAQRVYNAMFGATVTPPAPNPSLLTTLIDHMGPQVLQLNGLPNTGWARGAQVMKGADLRAIATPSWWGREVNGVFVKYDSRLDLGEYWQHVIPWTIAWDITGHQTGVNARYNERNCQLWALYDDTNQWVMLCDQYRMTGNFFQRALYNPQVGQNYDERYESDNTISVRFAANGEYIWHGYGGWGFADRPARVRALIARVQVRKVVHSTPTAGYPDGRSAARYAVHVGADAYPRQGSPQQFGWPWNPGQMLSRFFEVTNDWQWVYAVTLSQPPANSVDTSYPYLANQTISQTLLANNLPVFPT